MTPIYSAVIFIAYVFHRNLIAYWYATESSMYHIIILAQSKHSVLPCTSCSTCSVCFSFSPIVKSTWTIDINYAIPILRSIFVSLTSPSHASQTPTVKIVFGSGLGRWTFHRSLSRWKSISNTKLCCSWSKPTRKEAPSEMEKEAKWGIGIKNKIKDDCRRKEVETSPWLPALSKKENNINATIAQESSVDTEAKNLSPYLAREENIRTKYSFQTWQKKYHQFKQYQAHFKFKINFHRYVFAAFTRYRSYFSHKTQLATQMKSESIYLIEPIIYGFNKVHSVFTGFSNHYYFHPCDLIKFPNRYHTELHILTVLPCSPLLKRCYFLPWHAFVLL